MRGGNRIAIDIGAASARMIAGRLTGGTLGMREFHRFPTGDVFLGGQRVRNLYRWYEEILEGLRKYARTFGEAPESLGVDAMGEDFVLRDEAGGFLALPRSYRDPRDIRAILAEEARFGNEHIYAICGNQSVANDSLRQLIGLGLEHPRMLEAARGILFLADAFHYLLCGNPSVEHSLASYGKLYDLLRDRYSDEIFHTFSLPDALKSPVCRCGDALGPVYAQICREVGFAVAPEVIAPASHDTACAAFAVPDDADGYAFISSGSWSLVGMPVDRPYLTREAFSYNLSNSSMPWRRFMLKSLVAGMWIVQRCQAEWRDLSFPQIARLAERADAQNALIDPDAARFFSPECMTDEICRDVRERQGIRIDPADAGAVARLIFESLALKYRVTLERLEAVTGLPVQRVHIVGGGSQNALLNQLTADATGRPVYTSVVEASAAGNLLCQMIGAGELSGEEAARRVARDSFKKTLYAPRDAAAWREKARRFEEACRLGVG